MLNFTPCVSTLKKEKAVENHLHSASSCFSSPLNLYPVKISNSIFYIFYPWDLRYY